MSILDQKSVARGTFLMTATAACLIGPIYQGLFRQHLVVFSVFGPRFVPFMAALLRVVSLFKI